MSELGDKIKKFSPELDDHIIKGSKFFEEHIDEIREKYGTKTYVAIHYDKIVGSSPDNFDLYRKLHKEYKQLFITSIESYNRKIIMDSFEISRTKL